MAKMPMGKSPMGKPTPKGEGKVSKPTPKDTYRLRLAKPEPDNLPIKPFPKATYAEHLRPRGSKARMKRLKGAAL